MTSCFNGYLGGDVLRRALQSEVKVSEKNESSCQSENSEISCRLPQNSSADYGKAFQVDRSSIQSVAKENQAHELHSLEISVYDQDVLERGIIQQVDKALAEEKSKEIKKRYDVQIKSLQEDIRSTEDRVKNSESSLQNLPIKEFVSNVNEALLLRREIDSGMKSIEALKCREQDLLYQRKQLDKQTYSEDTGDFIVEVDDSILCAADELLTPDVDKQRMEQNEETENQRLIRLGQMTPFGTTLSSNFHIKQYEKEKLPDKEIQIESDFIEQKVISCFKHEELSLRHNLTLNIPGPSGLNSGVKLNKKMKETGKMKKKPSVLKRSILNPVKKRSKNDLGTNTSYGLIDYRNKPGLQPSETNVMNLESSGSEYVPSDDEVSTDEDICVKSLNQRKKTNRRKMTIDKWGTDDSDWEYSDDESIKRRRKRSKKVIDDGNLEDFLERLKIWEKERKEITAEEDGHECGSKSDSINFQELAGGLKIPSVIWNKLFSFQKVGVQWMWELHQQKCGGILGDEMGLGKTIQVVAFTAGLASSPHLNHYFGRGKGGLGPSLIVCPTTVLHQWVEEFHSWWPPLRVAILHDSGSFSGRGGKAALVKSVRASAGILVTSYEGLSRMADDLSLLDWHLVVLDEGHIIRNPDARVTLAAKRLRTPHRLLLSGSPIQNNLRELWSLFDFIYPGKLGTLPVFTAEFAIPISQGGYATASQVQVVTGYKCATVLKDTISPYLLRRMKADVKDHINLPNKNEQVLFCRLTDEQRAIYREYLKSGDVDKILTGTLKVFVGLINLRKICNHPDLYTGGPKLLKGEKEDILAEEERYGYWKKSGKMIVVENLLRIWHRQSHRVLLFTQGRQMMCILENFLRQQGYTYLKLDGSTNISARQPLINEFNQNSSHFIFLLTTKVGGLGVNLTGANRVLIYDPDWNPATDTQARERAWRPGQLRHVTVYRLVTAGTIEEKIYHRQIFKQFLTDRVLRDPRRRRFFKSNDLYELFTLQEDGEDLGKRGAKTETSAIFAGTGSEIKISLSKSKRKEMTRTNERKDKVIGQKRTANDVGIRKSEDSSRNNFVKTTENDIIGKRKRVSHKQATSATDIPEIDSSVNNAAEENTLNAVNVTFSKEKIEMMKKLAQNLSLKIAKQLGQTDEINKDIKESDFSHLTHRTKKMQSKRNRGREQSGHLDVCDAKELKHHSGKSKKRREKERKECTFEGERVAHLVGCEEESSRTKSREGKGRGDEEVSLSQGDYVLKKLFSKSGLQTALHHDIIMEGGEADYALVEGEAERVAHEAVKALQESRRKCWAASAGVPTWTGQHGMLCENTLSSKPKLRFGNKKSHSVETGTTAAGSCRQESSLSSSELLSHIRGKDSLLEYFRWKKRAKERSQTEDDSSTGEKCLLSSGVTREQADLLDDIRAFVACGASQDGLATTKEILARFKDRLPLGATPQLFKSMLKSVCNFESLGATGSGLWKLKPEFCG